MHCDIQLILTQGLHKDCKCKDSKPDCPNLEEKYLNCGADYCKGEKKDGDDETKCTAVS